MIIWTAFIIGLAGSFHCVGMCGPIAVALPVPNTSNLLFFTGRVLYNLGRVAAYTLMGGLFGLLGGGIILAGFQQGLSITLGVFMLAVIFLPAKYKNILLGTAAIQKLITPVKNGIGKLFSQKSLPSFFSIGFLNGFLPCGFVYAGIAGAMYSGSFFNGVLFMLFFGLGTFPFMFAVSFFGKYLSLNVRKKFNRAVPVFAFVLAVIFILRGLNLGIPYVSPKLGGTMHPVHKVIETGGDCCKGS